MTYKWIGAICIVVGCGGAGFSIAASQRREEALLRQMMSATGYMESELQYRLTPLPQLCHQTAEVSGGLVRKVFELLARELEQQILPHASDCMAASLALVPELPDGLRQLFRELGYSLGRMDLQGQITGLEAVRELCKRNLKHLENNREQRLRSYQTLGLCAGAALAILLI